MSLPSVPSPPVEVRPAAAVDLPDLIDFQLAMARETEGLALVPSTVARGVAAVLGDPGKGRYFVAAAGDTTLGGLMVTPEWSDWRAGTWWWIQSVYVRPEARGHGVFRTLYEHVKRRVEADPGLVGLRLYVARGNRAAFGVYRHLGMTDEHYDMLEWQKESREETPEG